MKLKLFVSIVTVASIIAGIFGGYKAYDYHGASQPVAARTVAPTVAHSALRAAVAALPGFSGIVAQSGSAVANGCHHPARPTGKTVCPPPSL